MTGCERIIQRLRQGPASGLELYALGTVAHSRISELRSRGYVIERTMRDGEGAAAHIYRLVSEPQDSAPGEPFARPAGIPVARMSDLTHSDTGAELHPDQLDLLSAA